MSDNEEKKQKTFYIRPVLLSKIFIAALIFSICHFIVGFDNIWNFSVWLCLILIEYWHVTLLILTFISGFFFLSSFDDEYEHIGLILIKGAIIIFVILMVYGISNIIKEKEKRIQNTVRQEQMQTEIIQPEEQVKKIR